MRRRPVLLLLLVALLTGCMAIPTSGPIGTGEDVPVEEGSAIPLANEPEPDAGPEQIVSGFLSAGAPGLSDEFTVAREFLTLGAARDWDPRQRVVVYDGGGPEITRRDDGTVRVSVPVTATVDDGGRYSEAVPGSDVELVFELQRDGAGQWRISALEDGILMSAPTFETLYRRTALYFASQDREELVPDVRWFPTRNIATVAVAQLLAGPSAWLRDAVVTGAPEGTRLATNAVTITDRAATVDLTPDVRQADAADRGLLLAQLEAVLSRLPGTLVTEVEVLVSGVAWAEPEVPELDRDPQPASGPWVLAGDRLAVVDRGEVVPAEDTAPLTGLDARSPALSLDEQTRVVLDGTTRLLRLPTDGSAPVVLLTGDDLVAPSVDRHGWVWSGERDAQGTVTAVRGDVVVPVAVEWLEGRRVHSLRIARDGTRAVLVSEGADQQVTVDVLGVTRDDDGAPQRLGRPLRIGAVLRDASEAAWVDEGTVAVLGTSRDLSVPAMHLVPLGGPSQPLSIVDGTVGIAAGRGDRSLYLAVDDGVLYTRQNMSWFRVAEDVRDPVFPG